MEESPFVFSWGEKRREKTVWQFLVEPFLYVFVSVVYFGAHQTAITSKSLSKAFTSVCTGSSLTCHFPFVCISGQLLSWTSSGPSPCVCGSLSVLERWLLWARAWMERQTNAGASGRTTRYPLLIYSVTAYPFKSFTTVLAFHSLHYRVDEVKWSHWNQNLGIINEDPGQKDLYEQTQGGRGLRRGR